MNENEEKIISVQIVYPDTARSNENTVPAGEEFLISVEIR